MLTTSLQPLLQERRPQAQPETGTPLAQPQSMRLRLTPASTHPHPLGDPQWLELSAFALCLDDRLDRAAGWDNCPNGRQCENRAYIGRLYTSQADARAAAPDYFLELAATSFPHRRPLEALRALKEHDTMEPINVVKIEGGFIGYDYRERGCAVAGAFDQLRVQRGKGDAWGVVREHRDLYGAHGALLPGTGPNGNLFVFLSGANELHMSVVASVGH